MCSAVKPMEPTKSGRPHDPMKRVSPVNALKGREEGMGQVMWESIV